LTPPDDCGSCGGAQLVADVLSRAIRSPRCRQPNSTQCRICREPDLNNRRKSNQRRRRCRIGLAQRASFPGRAVRSRSTITGAWSLPAAMPSSVLDMPHDPMAADPDRIEAPSRARRVLPPPSPVGDCKGRLRFHPSASRRSQWAAGPEPVHLIGMQGEPAAQRVIEIVYLARAEQKIISRFPVQVPVAGMPVRPGIGEVKRVNQRGVGVGAEQQRPILCR